MTEGLDLLNRRISPQQVADALPRPPILATVEGQWDRATLQRYTHPSGPIALPPVHDHIVTLGLNGSTLIEQVLEGGRTLRRRFDTGQINVLPAGSPLALRLSGSPDVLLLHIDPTLVQDVEKHAYGEVTDLGELPRQLAVPNDQLHHLAHLLLAEAQDPQAPGSQSISNSLVRNLIVQLLRRYKHNESPSSVAHSAFADPRIERALTFMRENLAEKITAEQLAIVSCTSRSSFSRLFRESVGQSAYQHLTTLRLEHAMRLLENTTMSITEIAYNSGFGQPTQFATIFRERYGVSPRAWRNANSSITVAQRHLIVEDRMGEKRRFLGQIRK